MSAQAMGWALDQDLPARPKLVLVAIANHADHTDGYCWLKAETIAREAACTPRSVFRFVGGLIRNGYLKKATKRGADGKQRANDYWILFNREDRKWDWGAGLGSEESDDFEGEIEADDDSEGNAETHGPETADPLDVVAAKPVDKHVLSYGPHDSHGTRQIEKTPVLSHGPYDSGVSHIDSLEPSKTNPENAGLRTSKPRNYRPPPVAPPQPLGATTPNGQIFVFEGTPAYEAWSALKSKESGLRHWHLAVSHEGRRGWWFPTLFPPEKPPPSKPSLATEDDLNEFAKTG